ncbi:hypothetical protein M9H77_23332 [Catharanthus roseus]|uniref:Uncharacterized protein n=1 Tax=Catharanthus roseus TaxID=4058 RepID=A0ACC0ATY7_CATRO|nr:hypothetical protein M9H77_23332 [Catharanthus roseus]
MHDRSRPIVADRSLLGKVGEVPSESEKNKMKQKRAKTKRTWRKRSYRQREANLPREVATSIADRDLLRTIGLAYQRRYLPIEFVCNLIVATFDFSEFKKEERSRAINWGEKRDFPLRRSLQQQIGNIERNVGAMSDKNQCWAKQGFHNFDNLTPKQTMRDENSSPHANFGFKDDLFQNFQETFQPFETQGVGRFGTRGGRNGRGMGRGLEKEFMSMPREQENRHLLSTAGQAVGEEVLGRSPYFQAHPESYHFLMRWGG